MKSAEKIATSLLFPQCCDVSTPKKAADAQSMTVQREEERDAGRSNSVWLYLTVVMCSVLHAVINVKLIFLTAFSSII